MNVIMEICRKFLTHHALPVKVTGTDTDRSLVDLTMSLSRTVFKIKGSHCIVFPPRTFSAPAEGVSIGIL